MAEYNIEINKYNANTDEYDILYPVTSMENIIGYRLGVLPQFVVTVDEDTTVTATQGDVVITKETTGKKCTVDVTNYGDWVFESGYGVKQTTNVNIVKQYTISLPKSVVQIPTQSGSLTYNNRNQSPRWNNYDSNKMNISGTTSATNAGSYEAIFTPKPAYKWPDGSSGAKKVKWSIGKAQGKLSISPTTLRLDTAPRKGKVTINYTGDGVVFVNGATSIVKVSNVTNSGFDVDASSATSDASATLTISITGSVNYTKPSDATCSVKVGGFVTIYGAQWDGTSNTKWTRTDAAAGYSNPSPAISNGSGSSPFDNKMPWSGMKRSTDSQAGELVSIPKFWYKWTKVGNGLKLQIADAYVPGFFVSPAHMNRGDGRGERDVVYVGRYHCSSSNWKSQSGVTPKNRITRSSARSGIHGLGGTIWQWDWYMYMTIWMLYLVEFADWNCQTTIGYGCGIDKGVESMGRTDSMKYHTGTSQDSRTTYGVGVQYRYIEGLWDNVVDWVDGCYYNSSGLNVINNPANFSDTSNGSPAGVPTSGYPSKFEVKTVNGFQVIYPVQSNGSTTTYTCDNWYFNAYLPCLNVGGDYYRSLSYGFGYVNNLDIIDKNSATGSRLQKLP